MKKSLLALAVLGAFASAASAQSSVTLYGRVDLSVGKGAGVEDKRMANGSGSRLGFRGVEDLGGGLQALFNIEHRFNADTGVVGAGNYNQGFPVVATPTGGTTTAGPATRFWNGRSIVGVQGAFGQVVLGREYTTSFLQSILVADPWGWDTVVSGTLGGSGGNTAITGGGIEPVRNDSSLTYKLTLGGFTLGAQVAEGTDAVNNFNNKPWNIAGSYAAGPITAGISYDRNGFEVTDNEDWLTLNGAFSFGAFKVGAFLGKGKTRFGVDRKSAMITGTAQLGAGELRLSYGELKDDVWGKLTKTAAIGYHYSLSKRTTVYADIMNDRGRGVPAGSVNPFTTAFPVGNAITTSKNGYDFGIKHNF